MRRCDAVTELAWGCGTILAIVAVVLLVGCAQPQSPLPPATVVQPAPVADVPAAPRVKREKPKREAKPKAEKPKTEKPAPKPKDAKKLPPRKQGCEAVPAKAYKYSPDIVMAAAERMKIPQDKLDILRRCINA